MVLFESMSIVALYTTIVIIGMIYFATGRNPVSASVSIAREFIANRKFSLYLIAMFVVMIFNKIELMIEARMTINTDFTALFYSWERGFVSRIQQWLEHPVLTTFLSFMYVVVFQAMLVASVIIYMLQTDKRMFRAICLAIIINYLAAIPFYLFFPILEVWAYDPAVRFLMLDAYPSFESQYRDLSGLDNCFPSLHTSISVTTAILAMQSGNRRWGWFSCISAAIIIFSIFYLGIHWFIDMLGGVALGVLASAAAMKLSSAIYRDQGAKSVITAKL